MASWAVTGAGRVNLVLLLLRGAFGESSSVCQGGSLEYNMLD